MGQPEKTPKFTKDVKVEDGVESIQLDKAQVLKAAKALKAFISRQSEKNAKTTLLEEDGFISMVVTMFEAPHTGSVKPVRMYALVPKSDGDGNDDGRWRWCGEMVMEMALVMVILMEMEMMMALAMVMVMEMVMALAMVMANC